MASRLVIISVDASTEPQTYIGKTSKSPSLASTINTMSYIQLQRYNSATTSEMKGSLDQLETAADPNNPLETYFVSSKFDNLKAPEVSISLIRFQRVLP